MKLIETYSRNASVGINHKPFLFEKYYPILENKYITLQNKSGMAAKDYSYFQEVVDLIAPVLLKNGYRIILLGKDDSPPLANVIDLRNKTSIAQSAYITKRASLHIGVDSWLCHYAAAEDVPLVSLYGSTTITNHSPYFYDSNKTIFLESDRNGQKASFARDEMPRMVDRIRPEAIASSVLKLLNLPFDYPYQTALMGHFYHIKVMESSLDNVINISNLGVQNMICRLDINFNLQNLIGQLQICPCTIITSKEIDDQILLTFRERIQEVIVKITKDSAVNFIKSLVKARIKFRMFSELPEDELNKQKLQLMDYGLIHPKGKDKPSEISDEDVDKGNIWYKSSKLILGRGKIYQSYYSYLSGVDIPTFDSKPEQIIKNEHLENLWAEKDHLLFLKKA